MTENTKEETEIPTLLGVEKFKSEIPLQDLRSGKYEIWLNNVAANTITYFTANYEKNICDNLLKLWDRDCNKLKEKSNKIFHGKEEWYLNNDSSGFRKEKNLKIAETPKMIGKVKTGIINSERRKTMIAVLAVEVTANVTHINPQQTNPLKMTKWPTPAEASKEKRRKERQLFRKIRPYKQRQKEKSAQYKERLYNAEINDKDYYF